MDIIEDLQEAYESSLDESMTVPLKVYSDTLKIAIEEIKSLRRLAKQFLEESLKK
jgi:predicted RecB family endonuclease